MSEKEEKEVEEEEKEEEEEMKEEQPEKKSRLFRDPYVKVEE